MKKMKLITVLLFVSVLAFCQPDKTFKDPVTFEKGFWLGGTLYTTIPTGGSVQWNDILSKPLTFPATAHTHPFSDVTGRPTTLAGYGITNGMTTAHAANSITTTLINSWSTAYGWGNHSGLYKLVSYVPTWEEVVNKPQEVLLSEAIPALNGIAVPRMTTIEINAIVNPPEGLTVYDLTLHAMRFYNGTIWKTLITSN